MTEPQKKRITRNLIVAWAGALVIFLYVPILCVVLASFSKARYFRFPVLDYTTQWYERALDSLTVRDLVSTSLAIALLVALISVLLAFPGALAFARYDWRGRRVFQRLVLLPIFFPQAVLGLALLIWFSTIGIIPDWRTAVVAHLVWIVPIVTLVISIQAYSFDPALEEAAFDLGATRWQTLREVTLPVLWPGVVSGALFGFLLSWGNFPLSLFTTGADSTVPEWLYAKMVSGYTPLVPTLGALTTGSAAVILLIGYLSWIFMRRAQGR